MPFVETGIPGLWLFEPIVFEDDRGFFFESFNKKIFERQGITENFIQDNQSKSRYGVIRGLHYQQAPNAQSKLVRALTGKVLDVAVDIRKGSPTYGRVYRVELSSENKRQLYIPKGFAHGFSVLSETAEVLYKCDAFYSKESEAGIMFNDDVLRVDWQIPAASVIVSDKDRKLPSLAECSNNFVFED